MYCTIKQQQIINLGNGSDDIIGFGQLVDFLYVFHIAIIIKTDALEIIFGSYPQMSTLTLIYIMYRKIAEGN